MRADVQIRTQGAEARRGDVIAARLAAVRAHLDSVRTKSAAAKAARGGGGGGDGGASGGGVLVSDVGMHVPMDVGGGGARAEGTAAGAL